MRIQHNIMAMSAYRNYNNNTSALSKNLEKLSSGYKINRAGDDAAGLAISEKMRAQITGLQTANKNVKDGISLVKTAEGAMQEIHDMLNRMDSLATQSANGTYDNDVDRANLQKEVDSLRSEINRIADSSNFNGIKLLDGSLDSKAVLGNKAMDLTTAVSNVTPRGNTSAAVKPSFSIDLDGLKLRQKAGATAAAGTLTLKVGGQDLVSGNLTATNDLEASAIANGFNGKTVSINGVTYTATANGSKLTFEADKEPTNATEAKADFDVEIGTLTDANTEAVGTINKATQVITAGKVAGAGSQATAQLKLSNDMLADGNTIKIGDQTFTVDYSKTGAEATGTTIGVKDLLNADGSRVTDLTEAANRLTKAAAANTVFTVGNTGGTITLQSLAANTTDLSTEAKVREQISVSTMKTNGSALTLQIGDTSDSFNQLSVKVGDMHTDAMGTKGADGTVTKSIKDISVATQTDAADAVNVIKDAINYVSSVRGDLGATQNRLEHTSNNLSVMRENIQDAESTIRDTDVADEMMAYTKNNILVQSAQAMLAQANQVPQGVLQLLQ